MVTRVHMQVITKSVRITPMSILLPPSVVSAPSLVTFKHTLTMYYMH